MNSGRSRVSVPEAWRCQSCDHLIYNVDADGYPAPGAPVPHYLNRKLSKVCSVCHFMRRELVDLTALESAKRLCGTN